MKDSFKQYMHEIHSKAGHSWHSHPWMAMPESTVSDNLYQDLRRWSRSFIGDRVTSVIGEVRINIIDVEHEGII